MAHAECLDAGERKVAARLERNGVALPDFLQHDQRHFSEDLCILGVTTEFLVRTHHRENQSFGRRSLLQFQSVPFEYGVVDGFGTRAAAEKIERADEYLRINVERYHVSSVACLAKKVIHVQEWADRIATWRRTSAIDGFPFALKESAKTSQRLAHIH